MTQRLTVSFLALALVLGSFGSPLSARAEDDVDQVLTQLLTSHQDDDDAEEIDEGDDEWSGYTGRYSSSLRRKIRKLDDDPVEHMPMPVLFVAHSSVTPDFGDPRGGGTRTHEGQDILAPLRSFVVSPTDAVVTSTGKGSSAGIYVYTTGPGDESFRYMHLDAIAPGVKSGTELKAGDIIGFVGNTGNASGGATHLHFELREGRKAIDPYPRLDGEFTKEELLSSLLDILEALKSIKRDED